jgi:peptide deformylase
MAKLPILHFPDPRLRTKAKPVAVVDDAIRQLIKDMFETMYDAPGIGLAATQVNHHIRLVVMDISEEKDQPMVFINPKVTPLTQEKLLMKKAVCLFLVFMMWLTARLWFV